MTIPIKVPEVGESIQEVEIAQWLKREGDWIEQDEDLVEIDTDKASLPIAAPAAGRLVKILKQAGDATEVGEVIAELDDSAEREAPARTRSETSPRAPRPEPERAAAGGPTEPARRPQEKEASDTGKPAGPVEPRRRAPAEPVSPVSRQPEPKGQPEAESRAPREETPRTAPPGSGRAEESPTGLTTSRSATPAGPAPREQTVPMSVIRRRIAARLVEAQHTGALLTTFNEIDMTAVMALRQEFKETFQQEYGIKLGLMSFFVKATIDALQRFPAVNAFVRGNDIIYHNYYDIGIAIGSGKGLVVPVLRGAEQMSFAEIERAIADFGERARDNRLTPDELTGGTFTISNGGVYGSLLSTPIVNPPQSGVLGMHAIQERPVAVNRQVEIRPMMYIALTYDHRIVDGREGVGFLRRVKELVEQPSRVLLEV